MIINNKKAKKQHDPFPEDADDLLALVKGGATRRKVADWLCDYGQQAFDKDEAALHSAGMMTTLTTPISPLQLSPEEREVKDKWIAFQVAEKVDQPFNPKSRGL